MSRPLSIVLMVMTMSMRLHAQAAFVPMPDLSDSSVHACVEAIDASRSPTVLVSLGVIGRWDESSPSRDAAQFLTQDVAMRLRALVGASPNGVPNVDSVLPWPALWGWLEVHLAPDGTVRIQPTSAPSAADSLAAPGRSLLERAVMELVAEGERWPFEAPVGTAPQASSIFFSYADAVEGERITRQRVALFPVFTRRVPLHRPFLPRPGLGGPRYPDAARTRRIEDDVLVRYRVDSTGTPIQQSIAEVRIHEDRRSRPYDITITGLELPARAGAGSIRRANVEEHALFVAAVLESTRRLRFSPGRIGECQLPLHAEQLFSFKLGR